MKECEECGKKLRTFEGYQHPTLGKKHLVCSPCFEQVEESVAKWREFVIENSPNGKTLNKESHINLKKLKLSLTKARKLSNNV